MPRRVSIPDSGNPISSVPAEAELTTETPAANPPAAVVRPRVSGRVRHDEKITVYVSRDELLTLEQGRLQMRRDFSLAVDRGRIVRESIAIVMEDLAAHGEDSELVRRLREQ